MDQCYLDLVNSLESNNPQVVEDAKKHFHNFFNSVKESWLMHGMFDLYMLTYSEKIVDIFAGVREPHDQYLFDKLSDCIKGQQKVQSLELFGLIVKRSPIWMYKVVRHSLMKDLLRLLKTENDIVTLMTALLPLIMLLPTIVGRLTPSLLTEIFDVFSRLAAWNTMNPAQVPSAQLLHLQVGLYTLFIRLYGMYPVNFIHYLKTTYSNSDSTTVFSHTIRPMMESVKMNPLLIMENKEKEVTGTRWKEMEPHEILVECSKMAVPPLTPVCDNWPLRSDDSSCFRSSVDLSVASNTGGEGFSSGLLGMSRALTNDTWSPTVFMTNSSPPTSAPTSIPHTPISQLQSYVVSSTAPHQEGTSPPEAAVEATPESTPVKDLRGNSREPAINTAIAVNLSASLAESQQPSSPLRKDTNYFRYPPASPLLASTVASTLGPPESPAAIPPSSQVPLQAVPRLNHYASHKIARLQNDRNTQLEQISRMSPNESSDQEDKEVEATLSHAHTSTPVYHSSSSSNRVTSYEASCECSLLLVKRTTISPSVMQREDWSNLSSGISNFQNPALSMKSITGFNLRMRRVSNCIPDTKPSPSAFVSGSSVGNTSALESLPWDVRRTTSCPEMKKTDKDSSSKNECEVSFLSLSSKGICVEESSVSVNGLSTAKEKQLVDGWAQTDDWLGHGYEQLFPHVVGMEPPKAPLSTWWHPDCPGPLSPRAAVDLYIELAASSGGDNAVKSELSLVLLELSMERHRRRMHADRNRRLSGKGRDLRAMEENNSALRCQMSILENEIKKLRSTLKTLRTEKYNHHSEKGTADQLSRENRELMTKLLVAQDHLDSKQSQLLECKAKEWELSQAQMLELESSKQSVLTTAARADAEEIARLSAQLLCARESEVQLINIIQKMKLESKKAAEAILATDTFNYQLQKVCEEKDGLLLRLEAAKAARSDAEAELVKKDRELEQLRMALRNAAELSVATLSERDERIRKLHQLVSAKEEETTGLLAKIEAAEAALATNTAIKRPQSSPPLSASLSSSGTISLSGTEPSAVMNLQLLLDSHDEVSPVGHSGSGTSSAPPSTP